MRLVDFRPPTGKGLAPQHIPAPVRPPVRRIDDGDLKDGRPINRAIAARMRTVVLAGSEMSR